MRALVPLLRLALPVAATGLTLGSLLLNTMSGGSVLAWTLTGVSAVACAGAWLTYVAASRAASGGRRRSGGRTRPSAVPAPGPEPHTGPMPPADPDPRWSSAPYDPR